MFRPFYDENGKVDFTKSFLPDEESVQNPVGGTQGALALSGETENVTPFARRNMQLATAITRLNQNVPDWADRDDERRRRRINIELRNIGAKDVNDDELQRLKKRGVGRVDFTKALDVGGAVTIGKIAETATKGESGRIEDWTSRVVEEGIPSTFAHKAVSGVANLPPFLAEMAATGGLATLAKAGIRGTGRAALKLLGEGAEQAVARNLGIDVGEAIARRGLAGAEAEALKTSAVNGMVPRLAQELSLGQIPGRVALRGAESLGGLARPIGILPKFVAEGVHESLPVQKMNLTDDDRAVIEHYLGDTPTFRDAFIRSLVRGSIEMWSEGLGELFGGTARALGVDAVLNIIPPSLRTLLTGKALTTMAAKANGNKRAFLHAVDNFFSAAKLDNMLEEWGEEDIGQLAQYGITQLGKVLGAPGLDLGENDPYVYGDKEEMLLRAIVLGVPQIARGGVRAALSTSKPKFDMIRGEDIVAGIQEDEAAIVKALQDEIKTAQVAGGAMRAVGGPALRQVGPSIGSEAMGVARGAPVPATPVVPGPLTPAGGIPVAQQQQPQAALPIQQVQQAPLGRPIPIPPTQAATPAQIQQAQVPAAAEAVAPVPEVAAVPPALETKPAEKQKRTRKPKAEKPALPAATAETPVVQAAEGKPAEEQAAVQAEAVPVALETKPAAKPKAKRQPKAKTPAALPVQAAPESAQTAPVPTKAEAPAPTPTPKPAKTPVPLKPAAAETPQKPAAGWREGFTNQATVPGEKGAPRYHTPQLDFEDEFDRAAYIIAKRGYLRKRDKDYLKGAMAASKMTWEQVIQHGSEVREAIKRLSDARPYAPNEVLRVPRQNIRQLQETQNAAEKRKLTRGNKQKPGGVAQGAAVPEDQGEVRKEQGGQTGRGDSDVRGKEVAEEVAPPATQAAQEAEAEAEALEPWQMSKKAYKAKQKAAGKLPYGHPLMNTHGQHVLRAVREGKNVPAEVLEEYAEKEDWAKEALKKERERQAKAAPKTPRVTPALTRADADEAKVVALVSTFKAEAPNAVKVMVVKDHTQFHPDVAAEAEAIKKHDPHALLPGVFVKDVGIYLNAKDLVATWRSRNRGLGEFQPVSLEAVVYAVWLHEQGHRSFQSFFKSNADATAFRMKIYNSVGRRTILDLIGDAYDNINTPDEMLAEEYIMHIADKVSRGEVLSGKQLGVWRSFKNIIQIALKLLGLQTKLSDKDIADVVKMTIANIYVKGNTSTLFTPGAQLPATTPQTPTQEEFAFSIVTSASESRIGTERADLLEIPDNPQEQEKFHDYMQPLFRNEMAAIAGVNELPGVNAKGFWKDQINPLTVRPLYFPDEELNPDGTLTNVQIARVKLWGGSYGIIFRQDGTSWLHIPPKQIAHGNETSDAAIIDAGRPLDANETKAIASYLEKTYPGSVAYVTARSGAVVLNWTGTDIKPGIQQALNGFAKLNASVYDTIVQSGLIESKDSNKNDAIDQNYIRTIYNALRDIGRGTRGEFEEVLRDLHAYRSRAAAEAEKYAKERGFPFKRDRFFPSTPADVNKLLKGVKAKQQAQFSILTADDLVDLSSAEERQIETESFKRWFGNSTVTYPDGTPRPMFHGTFARAFTSFDPDISDFGIHVGTLSQAAKFTRHGKKDRILKLWVRAENPLRMRDLGIWDTVPLVSILLGRKIITQDEHDELLSNPIPFDPKAVRELLKSLGYDSIVYLNRLESSFQERTGKRPSLIIPDEEFLDAVPDARDSYILFDANQVKSALGNNGKFSLANKNFHFSLSTIQEEEKTWDANKTWAANWLEAVAKKDSNAKKDLSQLHRILGTIPYYGETVPQIKELLNAGIGARDNRNILEAAIFRDNIDDVRTSSLIRLADFAKKRPGEWAKLTDYLFRRDMDAAGYRVLLEDGKFNVYNLSGKKVYGSNSEHESWQYAYQSEAKDLIASGYSEEAAQMLLAVRHTNYRIFLQLRGDATELINLYKAAGLAPPRVADPNTGQSTDLIDVINSMGDRRGYYMPRLHGSGRYLLWASKPGENPYMRAFDTPGYVTVLGKRVPLPFGRAMAAAKMQAQGWEVTMSESKHPSEEAFGGINVINMNELIQNALENVRKRNLVDTWQGLGVTATIEKRKLRKTKANPNPDPNARKKVLVLRGIQYSDELREAFKPFKGQWYPVPGSGEQAWHFDNPTKRKQQALRELIAMHGANVGIIDAIGMAFVSQIAAMIHARGSRQAKIGRSERVGKDVYVGYDRDVIKALALSGSGVASGSSRRLLAKQFSGIIMGTKQGWASFSRNYKLEHPGAKGVDVWKAYMAKVREERIDSAHQPVAYKEAIAYSKDMLRVKSPTERVIGTTFGIASLKYLSGIAPGLVNLSALPTTVVAAMRAYAKIPISQAPRFITKGLAEYGKFFHFEKSGKGQAPTGEMGWLLNEISKRGYDNAQWERESMNALMGRMERSQQRLMEMALVVFSITERLNRGGTIVGTYLAIKANHKGEWNQEAQEAALAQAKHVSDRAHAIYGKESAHMFSRGDSWGQVARSALMFKTFAHNYLQLLVDIGFKQKDMTAALWLLASPAVIAGAGASIATPALKALIAAVAFVLPGVSPPDDPEEGFYAWVKNNFGETGEIFARTGLAGLGGVNLKGSLAIGITDVPGTLPELLGAPASVFTDIGAGIGSLARGDILKGAEKLSPRVLSGPFRAIREYTEGATMKNNQPIYFGGSQLRANEWEAMLRFIGFNPSALSSKTEQQWAERKLKQKYDEKKTDIGARVRALSIPEEGPSREDWIDVLGLMEEYNARVEYYRPIGVTKITETTLKRWVRAAREAPKTEREREMAEEPEDTSKDITEETEFTTLLREEEAEEEVEA